METKSLLYGLIGFFMGGLLVSVAATANLEDKPSDYSQMSHTSQSLEQKTGDEFDAAYIRDMIAHHEGAVEMSRLAESNASHEEIKDVARRIVQEQQSEIDQFRKWQNIWNYSATESQSH